MIRLVLFYGFLHRVVCTLLIQYPFHSEISPAPFLHGDARTINKGFNKLAITHSIHAFFAAILSNLVFLFAPIPTSNCQNRPSRTKVCLTERHCTNVASLERGHFPDQKFLPWEGKLTTYLYKYLRAENLKARL